MTHKKQSTHTTVLNNNTRSVTQVTQKRRRRSAVQPACACSEAVVSVKCLFFKTSGHPGRVSVCVCVCVCMCITAVPITNLFEWGGRESGGHVL
jgi:hypothetical protein